MRIRKRMMKMASYDIKDILSKLFEICNGKEEKSEIDSEMLIDVEGHGWDIPEENLFIPAKKEVSSVLLKYIFDLTANIDDVLTEEQMGKKEEIIKIIKNYLEKSTHSTILAFNVRVKTWNNELNQMFISGLGLDSWGINGKYDNTNKYRCYIDDISISDEGIFHVEGECYQEKMK